MRPLESFDFGPVGLFAHQLENFPFDPPCLLPHENWALLILQVVGWCWGSNQRFRCPFIYQLVDLLLPCQRPYPAFSLLSIERTSSVSLTFFCVL